MPRTNKATAAESWPGLKCLGWLLVCVPVPADGLQVEPEDLQGRRQTVHTAIGTTPQQFQVIYI